MFLKQLVLLKQLLVLLAPQRPELVCLLPPLPALQLLVLLVFLKQLLLLEAPQGPELDRGLWQTLAAPVCFGRLLVSFFCCTVVFGSCLKSCGLYKNKHQKNKKRPGATPESRFHCCSAPWLTGPLVYISQWRSRKLVERVLLTGVFVASFAGYTRGVNCQEVNCQEVNCQVSSTLKWREKVNSRKKWTLKRALLRPVSSFAECRICAPNKCRPWQDCKLCVSWKRLSSELCSRLCNYNSLHKSIYYNILLCI